MKLNQEKKLSNLLLENFRLIPIITRFGIKLGFGDKTIDQVCEENNINSSFFIEIINVFNHKEYSPDKEIMEALIPETVEYLLKSHKYYNEKKIPLIENLINKLTWETENNKVNRNILTNFFNEYKKEVRDHTLNEETVVYPYVLDVYRYYKNISKEEKTNTEITEYSINDYSDKHEELNSALLDLKNIIIKYLPPAKNADISEQILDEVFKLEKDMEDHTRIEDTILVPVIRKFEKKILKQK